MIIKLCGVLEIYMFTYKIACWFLYLFVRLNAQNSGTVWLITVKFDTYLYFITEMGWTLFTFLYLSLLTHNTQKPGTRLSHQKYIRGETCWRKLNFPLDQQITTKVYQYITTINIINVLLLLLLLLLRLWNGCIHWNLQL